MEGFHQLHGLKDWRELEAWLLSQDAPTQKRALQLLQYYSENPNKPLEVPNYPKAIQRNFERVVRTLRKKPCKLVGSDSELYNEALTYSYDENRDAIEESETNAFQFPPDKIPADLAQVVNEKVKRSQLEFIERIAPMLLNAKDTRKEFICLLYLTGANLVYLVNAQDNTIKSVAQVLGVAKQTLHKMLRRVARDAGIDYLRASRRHRVQRKRNVAR